MDILGEDENVKMSDSVDKISRLDRRRLGFEIAA